MIRVQLRDLCVPLHDAAQLGRINIDHHLKPWIAERLGVPREAVRHYRIQRRSLDARHKPKLLYRYHLDAELEHDPGIGEDADVQVLTDAPDETHPLYQLTRHRDAPRSAIVVGTGPAGIMAAYLLALHGCRPVVIDRGYDVERRGSDLDHFHRSRILDPDSNYLYGEGGAGTYSDGKLYTRVKDYRMHFLLEAFIAARAPKHIGYRHHPHIGSDILPHMARRLRTQIEAWGGSFRWGATVDDIIERDGRCRGVVLSDGEHIEAPITLLAVGHSARPLLSRLAERGIDHKAKGYQIGCRIEHGQALIDRAQYACSLPDYLLGAAEYHLVSRPKQRQTPSTTTFCMCPGGEIIAATSDRGQLSTNGMSRFARNSPYANAGLIVNQDIDRENPLTAFARIDAIERAAFLAGGEDYRCPAQHARAFLRGEAGPPVRESSYRLGLQPGRIDTLLPESTVRGLRAALRHFERIIPGFIEHGNLVGVETRVSSPLRFERHPETLAASLPGLYLAGEGAGYAGGIVSAGLDGLRLAETILTGVPARRSRHADSSSPSASSDRP